jgi:prepilin-type N-terminal cleavage/methylation domain-containing protein
MNNERGVTLLELLLAVSIMGVIILPLTMLSSYLLQSYRDIGCRNNLQHESQLIMEYLSVQIREGASWDFDQKQLIKRDGGSEELVFRYDAAARTVYATSNELALSSQVAAFMLRQLPTPRSFEVMMTLEHPSCGQPLEASMRMMERETIIEYGQSEE